MPKAEWWAEPLSVGGFVLAVMLAIFMMIAFYQINNNKNRIMKIEFMREFEK